MTGFLWYFWDNFTEEILLTRTFKNNYTINQKVLVDHPTGKKKACRTTGFE
jgi:hypothetical protein